MPKTIIRLAAGRHTFSETEQAMAFMAGAVSPQRRARHSNVAPRTDWNFPPLIAERHLYRRTDVDHPLFRVGRRQGDDGPMGSSGTARVRG